jgi:hypothetical protein
MRAFIVKKQGLYSSRAKTDIGTMQHIIQKHYMLSGVTLSFTLGIIPIS